MDYGYDEEGRRTHANDATARSARRANGNRVRSASSSSSSSSTSTGSSTHHPTHRRGGAESDSDVDDSSSVGEAVAPQRRSMSSSSDFSDDVELIVGETAGQSIDEPLVAASDIQKPSRMPGCVSHAAHTRLIESAATTTARTHPLLLTAATASHRGDAFDKATHGGLTRLDYLYTLSQIPARLKSLAFVGALHHGKTSLLHMLLGSSHARGYSTAHDSYMHAPGSSHAGLSNTEDTVLVDDVHDEHTRGKAHVGYVVDHDERGRGMTLRSHVVTATVAGSRRQPQTHVLTCIDTPGHADLTAEACAGVRLADAVVFCVDAVESLRESGEWLLRHAVLHEQLPIILVITKVDRLILELKLPPLDAYRKLRSIVDAVNNVILSCGGKRVDDSSSSYSAAAAVVDATKGKADQNSSTNGSLPAHNKTSISRPSPSCHAASHPTAAMVVSPEHGTVCFASARLGFFFTLEAFARRHVALQGGSGVVDETALVAALTRQLWGAKTFEQGRFVPLRRVTQRPTFVTWVLEPLYKAVAHAICGEDAKAMTSAAALCSVQAGEGGGEPLLMSCAGLTHPHSPLAAARAAVQQLLTGATHSVLDRMQARAEEAWDVLLDVLHSSNVMQRRLAWLQSRYGVCAGMRSGERGEDERKAEVCDAATATADGAVAIGTMMRRVGDEVVAVMRVIQGTLRCDYEDRHASHRNGSNMPRGRRRREDECNEEEEGRTSVSYSGVGDDDDDDDDDDESGSANHRVILYHPQANEADPFHTAHITGLFLSLTHSLNLPHPRDGSSNHHNYYEEEDDDETNELLEAVRALPHRRDDSVEAVRRGNWVRVREARPGQLVYVTGIPHGESSHFVLMSGSHMRTRTRLMFDDVSHTESDRCTDTLSSSSVSASAPHTHPLGSPEPRLHVSLELKDPQKMSRLQTSLRTLLSCHVGLDVHTEETGEISLTGCGELHLDSVLHTLRHDLCRGVSVGLSQPYVSFRETVLEEAGGISAGDNDARGSAAVLAMVGTRRCGVGCVSGRLPDRLTQALEYDLLSMSLPNSRNMHPYSIGHTINTTYGDTKTTNNCAAWDLPGLCSMDEEFYKESMHMMQQRLAGQGAAMPLSAVAHVSERTVTLWSVLRRDFGLDALAAQSIRGRGPDKTRGSSLLLDDTLAEEPARYDWDTLLTGFRAAVASGPLVAEPVHGVGVRVIYVDVAASASAAVGGGRSAREEGGGCSAAALLANARAAVRQSLLGARPRLLEPVWSVEVICPGEVAATLPALLQMRRGTVVAEEPIMATPLVRVRALVPVMDSMGLETQMRVTTHGQALPSFRFAHWDRVPGDPFDASIQVAPLEPAKGFELSRDFVLKTRFRKGLPLNLMAEF